jgi:hypothetical protein
MEFTNGQRVSHEQYGLGRVTGTYAKDFETQQRYDVVFDNVRGYKTVLGIYLTDAEPKGNPIGNDSADGMVAGVEDAAALEVVSTGIRDRNVPAKPFFDGPVAKSEVPRLALQHEAIRDLMSDRQWRTLGQIAEATGYPEASISAQLRHLRKPRFGSFNVEKRRVDGLKTGLWEYSVEPMQETTAQPLQLSTLNQAVAA